MGILLLVEFLVSLCAGWLTHGLRVKAKGHGALETLGNTAYRELAPLFRSRNQRPPALFP
jgi:hypothetical protein